jgi:hypothetical protein
MAYVSGAVEGPSDEAVLRRIVASRGADVHRVQVQHGKSGLHRALPGYNAAARREPWLVLVDLDDDFDCAPGLVASWLPEPATYMRFRVVVREVEAWLLADPRRSSAVLDVLLGATLSRAGRSRQSPGPEGLAAGGRPSVKAPRGQVGHAAPPRLRSSGWPGVHLTADRVRDRREARLAPRDRRAALSQPDPLPDATRVPRPGGFLMSISG